LPVPSLAELRLAQVDETNLQFVKLGSQEKTIPQQQLF